MSGTQGSGTQAHSLDRVIANMGSGGEEQQEEEDGAGNLAAHFFGSTNEDDSLQQIQNNERVMLQESGEEYKSTTNFDSYPVLQQTQSEAPKEP